MAFTVGDSQGPPATFTNSNPQPIPDLKFSDEKTRRNHRTIIRPEVVLAAAARPGRCRLLESG